MSEGGKFKDSGSLEGRGKGKRESEGQRGEERRKGKRDRDREEGRRASGSQAALYPDRSPLHTNFLVKEEKMALDPEKSFFPPWSGPCQLGGG